MRKVFLTLSLFFDILIIMVDKLSVLDNLFKGLKFKDAEYIEKTNVCVMNFLFNPESFKVTDENKKIIFENIKNLIGDYVKIELSFSQSFRNCSNL